MLSIIIPARNNAALTASCIRSALHSVDSLNLHCQFVLVDDASEADEGIMPVFQQCVASARNHEFIIVRANRHQHYTGVFSIGLHLANRENVLFLSNDMLITPTFFVALLGVAALSRDFGIVRGTSNYCDSHPEHRIVPPNVVSNYSHVETFSRAIFEIGGLRFTEDGVLSGDAVLIKRSVVERIGVLDLRFFGYFGDIDYGLRARLANFKLVCAKGAWLYHEGAGHIKADAKKQKMDLNSAHQQRMRLVEEAYQVFRQKWDMRLPPTYAQFNPRHLFEMAEKNTGRVDLKYELPPSIQREFHVC